LSGCALTLWPATGTETEQTMQVYTHLSLKSSPHRQQLAAGRPAAVLVAGRPGPDVRSTPTACPDAGPVAFRNLHRPLPSYSLGELVECINHVLAEGHGGRP
jgi:hypothetical protein